MPIHVTLGFEHADPLVVKNWAVAMAEVAKQHGRFHESVEKRSDAGAYFVEVTATCPDVSTTNSFAAYGKRAAGYGDNPAGFTASYAAPKL